MSINTDLKGVAIARGIGIHDGSTCESQISKSMLGRAGEAACSISDFLFGFWDDKYLSINHNT